MVELSKKFLEDQKLKLLAEKKRLEDELGSVAQASKTNPENYNAEYENMGDDVDANAAEVYTFETRLALEHDLEKILQKINEALQKIDKGGYGRCEQGDDIENERLKAIPWAATCIKHAT